MGTQAESFSKNGEHQRRTYQKPDWTVEEGFTKNVPEICQDEIQGQRKTKLSTVYDTDGKIKQKMQSRLDKHTTETPKEAIEFMEKPANTIPRQPYQQK